MGLAERERCPRRESGHPPSVHLPPQTPPRIHGLDLAVNHPLPPHTRFPSVTVARPDRRLVRPLFCPNPLAAVDRGVAAPAARPAAANRDRQYVNNASGLACVESRDHVSLDPCLPAERLDKYIFSQDLLSPAPQVFLRPSHCLCPTTKSLFCDRVGHCFLYSVLVYPPSSSAIIHHHG